MKRPFLLALFIGITITSSAQPKKKQVIKNSSGQVTTGEINQNNYNIVIEYLNQLADCMNSQSKVLESKEPYMKAMENQYAYKRSTNQVKADGFHIDPVFINDVVRDCPDVTPPSIMNATDVAFFKKNYQDLRNAFVKVVAMWSDLYTYKNEQGVMTLTATDGKEKYEQLNELNNNYHRIRKKLNTRNKEIQASLFHYSIAGSPYQEFYTDIYKDLNVLHNFSELINGYEDMLKNKATIVAALSKVEKEVMSHMMHKPGKLSGFFDQHTSFYTAVSAYIHAARELLVGADLSSAEINQRILRYRDCLSGLTEKYNQVIRR